MYCILHAKIEATLDIQYKWGKRKPTFTVCRMATTEARWFTVFRCKPVQHHALTSIKALNTLRPLKALRIRSVSTYRAQPERGMHLLNENIPRWTQKRTQVCTCTCVHDYFLHLPIYYIPSCT